MIEWILDGCNGHGLAMWKNKLTKCTKTIPQRYLKRVENAEQIRSKGYTRTYVVFYIELESLKFMTTGLFSLFAIINIENTSKYINNPYINFILNV